MSLILKRSNVLTQNPPAGDQTITSNGSDWNYAVTGIFTVAFVS